MHINGSLIPFIELGVGFNPELTGRENVFLNGALLGFSRDEMLSMYEGIVEFAELGKFMDQKLKTIVPACRCVSRSLLRFVLMQIFSCLTKCWL